VQFIGTANAAPYARGATVQVAEARASRVRAGRGRMELRPLAARGQPEPRVLRPRQIGVTSAPYVASRAGPRSAVTRAARASASRSYAPVPRGAPTRTAHGATGSRSRG